MAKSAPSTDNVTGLTSDQVRQTHAGHKITRVGSFSDNNESNRGNMTYEVFYCRDDHKIFVI